MESMPEWKKHMEKMNAPCKYQRFDEKKGKVIDGYPMVNCSFECDGCGWNPAEQERRLKTGELKPVEKRVGYDIEKGVVIPEVKLPEGTRQLVFKKKEES